MRRLLFTITTILFLLSAPQAKAALVTYTFTPPGGYDPSIPDNSAVGKDLEINVTDTFDLLSFESVSVGMTHNFVGDVAVTLTHVGMGTTIDLVRRAGSTNGAVNSGDNSNFNGTYTFTNAASTRIIDSAATGTSAFDVPTGSYAPTTNSFNGNGTPTFAGESVTNLTAVFSPISNVSGIWRLNVSDLSSGQTGNVTSFSFTIDAAAVPEPGSMLLLGGALLAGSGWRLRKKQRPSAQQSA